MSTSVQNFIGVQSGKTTVIVGALRELHSMGLPVILVADNEDQAHWLRKHRAVNFQVVGAHRFLQDCWGSNFRAIGVDCTEPNTSLVARAALNMLSPLQGATQLLIARN
jgi:hypothetical protein